MIQENELQILGLNKYEAEVYKSLIRLGKASSVEISHDSSVPYGRIYDILSSLVNKKLARVIPEKTKKFSPSDPEILDEILKKKFEELNKIKTKIESLKENYSEHEEEMVWIVKGKNNFYKTINELPSKTREKFSIRYNVEYNPKFIHEKREQKNIKSLVRVDAETKENIEKWKKHMKKHTFRKIENKGIAMDIRDNYVWISLIKSNTLIVIKDKPFIDIMKTLFLNTYKNAEEIK